MLRSINEHQQRADREKSKRTYPQRNQTTIERNELISRNKKLISRLARQLETANRFYQEEKSNNVAEHQRAESTALVQLASKFHGYIQMHRRRVYQASSLSTKINAVAAKSLTLRETDIKHHSRRIAVTRA